MEPSGISTQYPSGASSIETSAKPSGNAETIETFQKALMHWEKQIKDKIDKDLENDKKNNIEMSEKQWRSLMNKVDYTINNFKEEIKEQTEMQKKQNKELNASLHF